MNDILVTYISTGMRMGYSIRLTFDEVGSKRFGLGNFNRDKIRRNLWPELYVKKYGIHTLFRIRLSKGRRVMYTISGTRDSKIVTILEVLDHGEYENRFGYCR